MTALRKPQMTVDEYLSWSEGREGRWELIDGAPLRMEAERVAHAEVRFATSLALHDAIRRAKLPCQVLPDGVAVRISARTAYEPDVLARCGPRLPGRVLEVPDPTIVVEVLSPSSAGLDYGDKVDGYFSVATVQHYLVLSPEERKVVHFRRGPDGAIVRDIVVSPRLRLDPPGFGVEVAALFDAGGSDAAGEDAGGLDTAELG